ncbi:MAG TPA: hypothetical protein VGS08_01925 [Candidatus Saccharimonadales bacterium]|nr:hypothetical protein [Candidatus Saccharimonadales bacterium]
MKRFLKTQTIIGIILASLLFTVTAAPLNAYAAAPSCPTLSQISSGKSTGQGEKCLFYYYAQPLVDVLSGIVGVAVVISLITAGIQYSSAAGDSGKVSAAKERIRNSIIAIFAYLVLLAFLQWLLPGGIV